MAKNTSIALGDHFDDFVQRAVASGRYRSASEVVRSALRLLEHEEVKQQALRRALIEGESSEVIDDFDHLDHLRSLHAVKR